MPGFYGWMCDAGRKASSFSDSQAQASGRSGEQLYVFAMCTRWQPFHNRTIRGFQNVRRASIIIPQIKARQGMITGVTKSILTSNYMDWGLVSDFENPCLNCCLLWYKTHSLYINKWCFISVRQGCLCTSKWSHANAATLLFYSKFTHVVGFYFVIECYLFTQGVIIIIFFSFLFVYLTFLLSFNPRPFFAGGWWYGHGATRCPG